MAINPEYNKTILRDENGVILLPQTTASMVSEEPDRRFVDNVEKSLINSLADNRVAIEALSAHYAELVLLAENTDMLLPDSQVQIALQGILANIEALSRISVHIDSLVAIANGSIQIPSTTSESTYALSVDDSSGVPVLSLIEILPQPIEPAIDPNITE